MEIEYDYWTGSVNQIFETLKRSISQYTRNYKVKIGITNNPKRRAYEHSRGLGKYKWMVVKYKTTSVSFVNQLEKKLIDYQFDFVHNKISGGGGPNGNGPYYLYILLK